METEKCKVTEEIASGYNSLVDLLKTQDKQSIALSGTKDYILNLLEKDLKKYHQLGVAGSLIDKETKTNAYKLVSSIYGNLKIKSHECSKRLAIDLKHLVPEPEPAHIRVSKRVDAARLLLEGEDGVVLVVSPRGVCRVGVNIDSEINQQSHHLHATLEALAESLGLINTEEEGGHE